jgi:hypothetical protein
VNLAWLGGSFISLWENGRGCNGFLVCGYKALVWLAGEKAAKAI